jgi:hypothetical protein
MIVDLDIDPTGRIFSAGSRIVPNVTYVTANNWDAKLAAAINWYGFADGTIDIEQPMTCRDFS